MGKAMRLGAPCAAMMGLLAAAALLTCGDANKDAALGPGVGTARDASLAIYGYVTNADTGGPLEDGDVTWYCDTCGGQVLGADSTNAQGRYEIYEEDWASVHPYHYFYGTAANPNFETGFADIETWDPEMAPVRKDFGLWPE
jgi:hypothetical protein